MARYFTSIFGYNGWEMAAMVLITGFTNLNGISGSMLGYQKNQSHRCCVGGFTTLTSFMYHFTESIGFEYLFLSDLQWHKLDNIGAICSVVIFLFKTFYQTD